jgi:hypothetical protein
MFSQKKREYFIDICQKKLLKIKLSTYEKFISGLGYYYYYKYITRGRGHFAILIPQLFEFSEQKLNFKLSNFISLK